MNARLPHLVFSASLLLAVATVPGCKPASSTGSSTSGDAAAPIKPVTVEVREDGLGYLPGATTPFTGEAVETFADAPDKVKKTSPWVDGMPHGEQQELYKNGSVKEIRRYKNGVPEYTRVNYKNGQLKMEMPLNANDKPEGPFRRWHANGQLATEAVFDSQERWHGEFKEWDEAGKLKSHLMLEHGVLKEVIFETPEAKAARQAPRPAPAAPEGATAPAADAAE